MLPGWLWLYDHGHYRKGSAWQQTMYWLHWSMIVLGIFFLVAATYGTVLEIKDAYADGSIGMLVPFDRHILDCANQVCSTGSAFSCADNSDSS